MPQKVRFKDEAGWRPVCPYFEVHGSWTADGERHTGPLTEEFLVRFGLGLGDVRRQVSVANLKAHHLTENDDDRIEATVRVRGDDHQKHRPAGTSPQGAARPLVPAGRSLPLGAVRVPVPNAAARSGPGRRSTMIREPLVRSAAWRIPTWGRWRCGPTSAGPPRSLWLRDEAD
ncbi:hypothetical protein [Streptomyces sp. NPDC059994]|uniref:hypothetical protein n=1 Tax=Streptomyces sp. NPDC059994 TaxID=3347029 RepID=UPI0036B25B0B